MNAQLKDTERRIVEMQELIEVAQKELCNLYDATNPAKLSWTDRQFNQIMRLLRQANEVL